MAEEPESSLETTIEAYPILDNNTAERPDIIPGQPRSLDRAHVGQILNDPHLAPPVKALIVWGTNPLVSQPDSEAVHQGLLREDLFTVVLEHFMTDTARHADIVLPSTTQLEHFDVQGSWGQHYIAANLPAIASLGEVKSHSEIMRNLAAHLGIEHPALQDSDPEIALSALPESFDLDALVTKGWLKASPPRSDPTSAGVALQMRRDCLRPLPRGFPATGPSTSCGS